MLRKRSTSILLIILVTSVFSVPLYSNSVKHDSNLEYDIDNTIDLYNLRLSGPEINITTPENITYTEPMSGYYPATYGFENDQVGTDPSYWQDTSDSSCDSQVIQEKTGHQMVVYMDDDNSGGKARLINDFSDQNNGAVEFWYLPEDATTWFSFRLIDMDLTEVRVEINIKDDKWQYSDDGVSLYEMPNVPIPQDNLWQHVKIYFECTTGGYHGLSQYKFEAVINGINSGELPFQVNGGPIDRLYFSSVNIDTTDSWVDAVAYSWDPNYNIGDNLHMGLLLSVNIGFNPDWLGYSIDGLVNKSILGNVSFPFLSEGSHTIQVFGNNSLGTIYESDIRYFTVDIPDIEILTPENIYYTGPMDGYYPATYGFENDDPGNDPQEWNVYEVGGTVNIKSSEGDHNKIIELYDTGVSTHVNTENNFEHQTFGTIEFWFRTDNIFKETGIAVVNDAISPYNFIWMFTGLQGHPYWEYNNGAEMVPIPNVGVPQNNHWHHIRIHFRCSGAPTYQGLSDNRWKVIIDGIDSGELTPRTTKTSVMQFQVATDPSSPLSINYKSYIDAVGYSWDPNYNIGDNLYEGLLLSFNLGFNPDWLGYSLDGLENKTILGNVSFPFHIDEGIHTIQVFGNDSLGTMYESNIRYFTINIPAPQILINSPQDSDYFGYSAPNFDISITTPIFDTFWYTLDNGITNFTFEGLAGTINQLEWENYGHGPVSIRFYLNDTLGQENSNEITINKDLNPPTSTLSFVPYTGINIIIESTAFTITANDFSESGVSIIRYKINNSGWLTYNGPFTLFGYSAGDYLITYQAIDLVGNIESEQVIVVELYIIHETPSEIPIVLIILIIVFASVGSALLIAVTFFVYNKRKTRIFVDEKKLKIKESQQITQEPQLVQPIQPKKPKRTKIKKRKPVITQPIFSCPFCQAELPGDQKFCFYCGAKLEE